VIAHIRGRTIEVMPDVEEVVTKVSPWSMDDTVSRLGAVVRAGGSKLFDVIDHRSEAAASGIDVPPSKLVVFGDPESWSLAIRAAPLVALEFPLKVLIWADRDRTMISYAAPAALASRYGLDPDVANRLAAVDTFTDAVIAL
jgi:uncharacterized protein (DUF302 family)